jgi:pimeloyl-ACP methyl ester carboxylesterase
LTVEDVAAGLEADLLLAWWRAAAVSDPRVASPDDRGLGAAVSVRAAVLALAGSRFLARVSERVLVFWLKQVSAYFTRPEVRVEIQRRFAEAVGADTRVVVAHSLGSVVAYEAMCAHPEWPVTDLVTLGSPLGVPHIVAHRLRPAPADDGCGGLVGVWPGVARWVNITDDADFVALQPRLRKVFGDRVTDVAISNGVSAHAVERYLSAAETGAAVLAGLRG